MGPKQTHSPRSADDKAVTLKSAVQTFLKSSGIDLLLKYPSLVKTWEEIAGAAAAEQARIVAFRRGTLTISVESSTLLNELEFRRRELIEALRQAIKRPYVANLSLVLKARRNGDE